MTDSSKNPSQDKMIDLFKIYQTRRTSGDINERLPTPMKVQNENASASSANGTSSNSEQVKSVYRAYQCNRDPYRAELCSLIMNAARENTKERRNQNQYAGAGNKNQSIIKRIFIWPNTLLTKITGKFTDFATDYGRLSVPIILFVIVAAIAFTQIEDSIQDDYVIALDDFPAVFNEHAADLSEKIRLSVDTTFAFSTGDDLRNNTFQIGVILTDLPLLVKADSHPAAIGLLDRLRQLAEKTDNGILLPSIHALRTTLTGAQSTHGQTDPQVLKLLTLATAQYANHDLDDVFKLGKWIEQTYLATLIQHQELDSQLLHQLFNQRKAISHNALQELENEPAAIALLKDLKNLELQREPTPKDIRQLQKKLLQIKAVLL